MDELREALDLATDEELQALTEILFRRKFNPLDYVYMPEPIVIQSQARGTWIDAIEARFQFLAADGFTVLRRKTGEVSYRQVLVQVCRYLKIACAQNLSTEHLEAEIFLFLLNRAWQQLPAAEQADLNGALQQAVSEAELTQRLPPSAHNDPAGLLVSGSAIAASSVLRGVILQFIARQYAIHAATYQVASQVAGQAAQAGAAIAQIQSQVTMQTASRSMALTAARYGTARSVFALLGPAMWTYFFADLGWRAIATNYSRVIPVVFTLAQIRLTRISYEIA